MENNYSNFLNFKSLILGVLIGINRKELYKATASRRFTQIGFTSSLDGNICCPRTLSDVEKGKLVLKNSNTYRNLLTKLDKTYIKYSNFDNEFFLIADQLFDAIRNNDHDRAVMIKRHMIDKYEFMENEIFYYETSKVIKIILNDFLEESIDILEFELYDQIIPYFPDKIKYLYYTLRIESMNNEDIKYEKYLMFCDLLEKVQYICDPTIAK